MPVPTERLVVVVFAKDSGGESLEGVYRHRPAPYGHLKNVTGYRVFFFDGKTLRGLVSSLVGLDSLHSSL